MMDIFLNGVLVGKHDSPDELIQNLRDERRAGKIPATTSIAMDKTRNQIVINSDPGRVMRPLIVVKDGKPLLLKTDITALKKGKVNWAQIIAEGKIEYLDASEEENTFIAITPDKITKETTHLELDPIVILGIPASLVPYANYSRGDRVNYGASKGVKQALGIYTSNFHLRFDTYSNILHYPQSPILRTAFTDVVGFDSHPAGQNFVVCIAPWEGYNMEDAVIFNKASIERGLGRSTFYRPYVAREKRYPGGQEDFIEVPDKDTVGYRTEEAYGMLGSDGIIEVESSVKDDDVLIGRTSPPRFLGSLDVFRKGVESRRESSVTIRHGEVGTVDQVVLTEDKAGRRLAKIRIRSNRNPELGDKFSSRHGQKGVIGAIVPQEDLPFSVNGTVPDMIVNPHGIPSRMTVSQVLEFITAKAGCLDGRFVDGTAFNEEPVNDLKAVLKSNGFNPSGTERFYDGITGEKFKGELFSGVIYYHKLRHMVANKMHSRARGPVQILTRQPTEGRSKKGGLRMGEMEKDCLVAHGAALVLKERFDSDKTLLPICEKCGLVAVYDKNREKTYCTVCGESAPVHFVEMSYAFHILMDELLSLGIYPRMQLEDKE